jgi:hypothetical protein
MSYVGGVGYSRCSAWSYKTRKPWPNELQVYKNAELSFYEVRTFALWGHAFNL